LAHSVPTVSEAVDSALVDLARAAVFVAAGVAELVSAFQISLLRASGGTELDFGSIQGRPTAQLFPPP